VSSETQNPLASPRAWPGCARRVSTCLSRPCLTTTSVRLVPSVSNGLQGMVQSKSAPGFTSDTIYLIQVRKKKPKVAKGAIQDDESAKASPSGSGRNSPAVPGASDERKTAAEKRFQEVQRKRVCHFARCLTASCVYECHAACR
jgi:hypothetical protein